MASSSTPNLKAYRRKFLWKHQVQERCFVIQDIFLLVTTSVDTVTKAFLCLLQEASPSLQFWWLQWHCRCLVKWLSQMPVWFHLVIQTEKAEEMLQWSEYTGPHKASIHYCSSPKNIYPSWRFPQKHLSVIAAFSAQNQVWTTTEQAKRKQRFAERKPLAVRTTKWTPKRVFCLQVHFLTHWSFTRKHRLV